MRKRSRSFSSEYPKNKKQRLYAGPNPTYMGTSVPLRLRGKVRFGGNYGKASAGELKFHDVQVLCPNVSPAAGFAFPSLNIIPQGDGQSERNGRKIVVRKISMRGSFDSAIQEIGTTRMRLIVALDKQCNGAAASVDTLLTGADIDSFRNLDNSPRFKVLLDKNVDIQPNTNRTVSVATGITSETCSVHKTFKWNKNVNIPIIYDSSLATGVLSTIRSNNLFCVVLAETVAANADFFCVCRLRYYDN